MQMDCAEGGGKCCQRSMHPAKKSINRFLAFSYSATKTTIGGACWISVALSTDP